jgi:kynurenine formamidase
MTKFTATKALGMIAFLAGLALLALPQPTRTQNAGALVINPSKIVDLTYDFDSKTIYWPNAKSFDWQKEFWDISPRGYWYAAGHYSASEHGGTHLDAPIHFSKGGSTVDEIPVAKLIALAVVIDISEACGRNRDYRLSVDDITSWEKVHGRTPDGAIVLVRTGWGKFWPDKKNYLGSDVPGDINVLHFPGFSVESARFLVTERKINGVGIDTASMDYGASRLFEVHGVFLGAGLYGLENIAHLDALPAVGATIIALPMKIKGGSGAPTRIIAILP